MTERFLSDGDPERPARKKDLQRLRDHVADQLTGAGWLVGHGGRLVGTGGAVRNLAAAAQRAQFGSSGGIDIGIQGFVLTADALDGSRRDAGRAAGRPSGATCPGSSRDAATSSLPRP